MSHGHTYPTSTLTPTPRRGVILIDYDDGTQEVSAIPDSDVVIYPWRPPDLRTAPRTLERYEAEVREADRERQGSSGTKSSNHAAVGTSRPKLQVKAEPPCSPPPRRKRVQSRDSRRRDEPNSGRGRVGSNASEAGGKNGGSRRRRGSRGGGGTSGKAVSSSEEEEESDEDEHEEEVRWDENSADRERDRGDRDARGGKDRWQQQQLQRGGRGGRVGASGRGRAAVTATTPTPLAVPTPGASKRGHNKQGQRKRPVGQPRRNGSAPKRQRSARDGQCEHW